ncbi:LuxR C-terminal-related transcriptional regulator (plasmid) [Arsenophonus nasoniae]|uniref:LuxR C-terminal-related transcriptional regulator n=2 Tax=Arsenophonus nasoniae TaxID=638 RepID=A0ABY8NW96_9GAMM|nr:PAS and helix-turn-helix domain-containing protein [Arsenophonus nasoniae]WGM08658.1 LuxR C-terminal-related transcriptional regulator [Arsenophonus nasoniae]WGM13440.1 LuxR C-terminal-related transcriptional regulator [Arsenophonus nasoniae]WGM18050.1 LuxR C-terminal-related transcriptional regulator [Arsenophonus nasoniae]
MKKSKDEIKSYVSSPQSLISFIKNSSDHWLIKDLDAKYIFVNSSAFNFFRFPKKFNPEGKSDREVPTEICEELWPEFLKNDKKAIEENTKIISIAIHHYGKGNRGELVPHLAEQIPLYDKKNKIIGLVGHGRRLDLPNLLYYINRLNRKTIQFDAPNNTFTKRELEVIFWAQQRLTAKEIAKRLDVCPSTIDSHIKSIYRKADVNSNAQLIEYCKHKGLDAYIPANFIRKGVQLIA